MKVRILGFAPVDFTSGDGKHIKGSSLYVAFADEVVTGEKCDKVFLHDGITLPQGTKIGAEVELGFNMRGKVESIAAIKA